LPVTATLHPLFLRLEGRRVLVVGAGLVAEKKIAELVSTGAELVVVAPAATDAVVALAADRSITWERRTFEERDLDGAWLVIAATADAGVQRRIADGCAERRVFCVAIDDVDNASAYSASVVRRAPFTIAISSAGESPALTRLVREILEQALPDGEWVEAARALRAKWRAEGTPMTSRFGELVRAFAERSRIP
jgi:uroporphyrin-III C-methyltransferase/precorrin-2 dehydrogenase/sirohydrochlorin ferrochelatase